MPPRERLRSKLRRRAEFLVQTGAARRPMTPAEIEHFLTCVENNSPNEFGLVRLSELALDDFLDVERRGYAWDAVRDVGLEGPQTLLAYAAWLGRAWIVRALLRAGADPSARPENRTPGVNTTPRGHLPNPSPRLFAPNARTAAVARHSGTLGGDTPFGDAQDTRRPDTCHDAAVPRIRDVVDDGDGARARAAKPRMRENRRDDDSAAACASCAARDRRARRVRAVSPRGVRGVRVAPRHRSPRRDGMPTVRRGDADAARPDTRAAREGRVSREVASPPPDAKAAADAVRFDDRSEGSEALAASTTVPKASETSNDPRAEGVETTREGELVGGRPAAAPDRWLAPGIVRVRGSRKTFVPEPRDARRVAESSNSPPAANATRRYEPPPRWVTSRRFARSSPRVPTWTPRTSADSAPPSSQHGGVGRRRCASSRERAPTSRRWRRAGRRRGPPRAPMDTMRSSAN